MRGKTSERHHKNFQMFMCLNLIRINWSLNLWLHCSVELSMPGRRHYWQKRKDQQRWLAFHCLSQTLFRWSSKKVIIISWTFPNPENQMKVKVTLSSLIEAEHQSQKATFRKEIGCECLRYHTLPHGQEYSGQRGGHKPGNTPSDFCLYLPAPFVRVI